MFLGLVIVALTDLDVAPRHTEVFMATKLQLQTLAAETAGNVWVWLSHAVTGCSWLPVQLPIRAPA